MERYSIRAFDRMLRVPVVGILSQYRRRGASTHSHRQIRSTSGAQSDTIGAPEQMSIEAVLATQNGGSASAHHDSSRHPA